MPRRGMLHPFSGQDVSPESPPSQQQCCGTWGALRRTGESRQPRHLQCCFPGAGSSGSLHWKERAPCSFPAQPGLGTAWAALRDTPRTASARGVPNPWPLPQPPPGSPPGPWASRKKLSNPIPYPCTELWQVSAELPCTVSIASPRPRQPLDGESRSQPALPVSETSFGFSVSTVVAGVLTPAAACACQETELARGSAPQPWAPSEDGTPQGPIGVCSTPHNAAVLTCKIWWPFMSSREG